MLYLFRRYLVLFSSYRKKLSWTADHSLRNRAESVFKSEMDKLSSPAAPAPIPSTEQKESIFIRFKTSVEKEPETKKYLDSEESDSLKDLELFPKVRSLYVRSNTTLPSSAAVERLFSCAGLIMTPLRSRVTDNNFEAKVLLNFNADL